MFNVRLREGGRTPGGRGQEPPSPGPREGWETIRMLLLQYKFTLKTHSPQPGCCSAKACRWPSKEGGSGGPEHGSAPFTERPSAEAHCPSPHSPEGWPEPVWVPRLADVPSKAFSVPFLGEAQRRKDLCHLCLLSKDRWGPGRLPSPPSNSAMGGKEGGDSEVPREWCPMSMTTHALLNPSVQRLATTMR